MEYGHLDENLKDFFEMYEKLFKSRTEKLMLATFSVLSRQKYTYEGLNKSQRASAELVVKERKLTIQDWLIITSFFTLLFQKVYNRL